MRMIGAGEIAGALPFAALVDHLAVALLQPAAAPLRLGVSRGTGHELLVMPAMSDRYAGVKVLTVTADNGSKGLPVIGGLFIFIDARTGETLAIMDAEELTARRTAAVSALATRALEARRAAAAPFGNRASRAYLAEAHATVRPVDTIEVWGSSPDKAARTAAEVAAAAGSQSYDRQRPRRGRTARRRHFGGNAFHRAADLRRMGRAEHPRRSRRRLSPRHARDRRRRRAPVGDLRRHDRGRPGRGRRSSPPPSTKG